MPLKTNGIPVIINLSICSGEAGKLETFKVDGVMITNLSIWGTIEGK